MKETKEIIQKLTCFTDLHLHLDGAVSAESARELAAMQNIQVPDDEDALLRLLRVSDDCRDLNEFLEKFAFPCSLLQTYEGLETAAYNLCTELTAQGIMYAEIRFAPQKSTDKGLTQREAVKAVSDGINRSGLECGLILCCMRGDDNRTENMETVDVCAEFLGNTVCALDLAGAEALFPTENFADVFEYARVKGVPFTVHAGEAAGAGSVKSALDFGASRIGHGVRAAEDERVLKRLSEAEIPLECCLTSNLNTALFKSAGEFPFRKLTDAGIIVTVNTDDPSIEGTDIKKEYSLFCETFSLTPEELKELILNSVRASFASDEAKKRMRKRIETEFRTVLDE